MMTSRERLLATLRHERADRVPLDGWFRPETERALAARFGDKPWREALGLDWGGGADCRIRLPAWEGRADLATRHGDWPGAGRPYAWRDDRTFEDEWGVVHRIGRDGKYVEWVSGPLAEADPDGREALERMEALFKGWEFEPVEAMAERVARTKAAGRLAIGGIPMPFKMAWMLRGMENWLCDYLANPDFAHRLLDLIYSHYGEAARRMAAAGADLITVTGDIASQDRLLFSHKVFEEFEKPRLTKLVEAARAAATVPHLYFFDHCDGDMSEVLPDLVEDIGFDVINPIQPECMDCYAVKKRYGHRITLHGTMSVVTLLPDGPVEAIRAMVRERIDRLAYNGGFILSSANVITFDTPLDHILAMYDEARRYTSDRWPAHA